jgi:putative two-component system response regulator
LSLSGRERIREARILVADDHDENVVLLRRILERAGYTRVTGITDSRQILSEVRKLGCDLVLLDLHMPHLDGFAVMDELQADLRNRVAVILVTGEAGDKVRQEAISHGASAVVTKPYELGTVLDVVERVLQEQASQR